MRTSGRLGVVVAGLLAAACGCGGPARVAPVASQDPCDLVPAPPVAPDALTVALLGRVNPAHAPFARNDDERLVFSLLYETLIDVDCTGNVRPALAHAWQPHDGGRRWSFELRQDARFWDGLPVTADDVAESWRGALTRETRVDSVLAPDDRHVDVFLAEAAREPPRMFAGAAYAVARPSESSAWPCGSGRYRVRDSDAGGLRLDPAPGSSGPVIAFVAGVSMDARDLIDRVDLMITDDPAAIAYAADAPRLDAVALPWSRTYVLLSTSRMGVLSGFSAFPGGRPADGLPPALREALARDAVSTDARGAGDEAWWDGMDPCGDLSAHPDELIPFPLAVQDVRGSRRIRYEAGDATARALAERIVALSAMDPSSSAQAAALAAAVPGIAAVVSFAAPLTAEAAGENAFAASLQEGADFAYVVALPRQPLDTCRAGRALVARAPWLSHPYFSLSDLLIPLVETRAHALAAKGRVGARVGFAGDVVIAPERRSP